MSGSPVRLLCTGDLHIGRFPSYVPPADRTFSVEHVWYQVVARAIADGVDAVILTGDVADKDNKLFEAYGPLKSGIEQLGAAGIRTVAVAGNHDFDVLRRLAKLLDPQVFTLLGAGGGWETTELERDGTPVLRLVGWSFSSPYARTSPLDTLPQLDAHEMPLVGVLHADVDQPGSPYAPVRLPDLFTAGPSAWLLGHVHKPHLWKDGTRFVLYPGSPQPLDPGEQGTHGAWLVTVAAGGAVEAEQLPLATLRYDTRAVSLEGVEDADGVERAILEGVEAALQETAREQPQAQRLVLDLVLGGRTRAYAHTERIAGLAEGREVPGPSASGLVRKVQSAARPHYDLGRLAGQPNPAGTLAQLILDLEQGREAAFVQRAQHVGMAAAQAAAFTPLVRARAFESSSIDEGYARRVAIEQSLLLLDAMLNQNEDFQLI